jgi:hypothetical protein
MTDTSPPDSLSDLDLARLLLSQERQRRVALQIDLLARQHADAKREQEQLQRDGRELQAELCARYVIGPTDAIDAKTGAITRKSASGG